MNFLSHTLIFILIWNTFFLSCERQNEDKEKSKISKIHYLLGLCYNFSHHCYYRYIYTSSNFNMISIEIIIVSYVLMILLNILDKKAQTHNYQLYNIIRYNL